MSYPSEACLTLPSCDSTPQDCNPANHTPDLQYLTPKIMRLSSCRFSRTRQKEAGEFLFQATRLSMRSASPLFADVNFNMWQKTYEDEKSSSHLTPRIYVSSCKTFDQMSTQSSSPCPSNSWAPSSAFYFLLSLALGCISHPRGSLTFRRSSRAWRLSPFFLLIENARICIYFLQCLDSEGWRWRWRKVRVYAYAVLALREGNAWRQIE
jgi:hypothetical protein